MNAHECTKICCNGCYRSATKGTPAASRIFARVCIPPPEAHLRQPVRVSLIHTGIHHSHIMAVYKGLYHCTKCGSILGTRIVKLGNSCIVPPSVAGKRNLDCISKDKFPQGVSEWPSDHPALPRYNPRPAGQLIAYHLQPASTPILERAQQFSASAAAGAA